MSIAIVSEKGWVVVPKHFREKYGLKPGSKVQIIDYGEGLSLIPLPDDPIAALRGMFAEGPSLTEDLIHERQQYLQEEEKRIGRPRSG